MTDAEDPTRWDRPDDEEKRQAREKAEEFDRMYEPGARPTTVVPGTNGMVSGTAFADMAGERSRDEPAGAGKGEGPADRDGAPDQTSCEHARVSQTRRRLGLVPSAVRPEADRHQPRSRHSPRCGRSAPRVESLPCPG